MGCGSRESKKIVNCATMKTVASLIISFKCSNQQCELTDRYVLARNITLFVVSSETKNWWSYGLLGTSMRFVTIASGLTAAI